MPVGKIVLAGGRELLPGCEEMDECVLRAAGGHDARVVFLPTAMARLDPTGSGRHAVTYFQRLGARCDVANILTRADADRPELAAMVERATLVYLGGGEPKVLLDVLRGSLAWAAVLRAYDQGAIVGGSSAGAMAVCSHTLDRGDRKRPGDRAWIEGLGLVHDVLVMPHFAASSIVVEGAATLAACIAPSFAVLGIPEQSGVLGMDGEWEVVGPGPVTVVQGWRCRRYAHGTCFTLATGSAYTAS